MHSTTPTSEYEPLIGLQNVQYSNTKNVPLKSRSYSFKHILLSIMLITTAVIVIYGVSQENINNPLKNIHWVRMEESDSNQDHIPSSWTEREECRSDHPFVLTLALKQQNTHLLDDHIDKVSNPLNSDTFHKYWNAEEVRSYFKPSSDTISSVISWLESFGFTEENGAVSMVNIYGNAIKVTLTCGDANKLLNTKYMFYEHDKNHKQRLRVKDGVYNIPSSIYEHIDFISPTIRFPLQSHTLKSVKISGDKVKATKGKNNQNQYNIPDRIYQLYSMDSIVADIRNGEDMDDSICRQSVGSFIEQYYSDTDIDLFWNTLDINPDSTMSRIPSSQEQGYGAEAELDTQYITSTGEGIYTYVYYIPDDEDPWISLSEAIWNTDNMPKVVSISYGADESDLGLKYATRCNQEFGKLALAGTTVLVSSGDGGCKGNEKECASGDIEHDSTGQKWTPSDDYTFVPTFPASAPYVTSVGGTEGGTIQSNIDSVTGETAWLYSGGGFSAFFDTPQWQQSAVSSYFANEDISFPDSSRYISTGRAYPDISAQSVDYVIALQGEWELVSGTSASSPTVAGMISMINYARIKAGKSSLGFLNPILYSLYDSQNDMNGDYNYYFNDITDGYNIGCSADNNIGFYTSNGWDPVTGVGTPKFSRLYEALLAMD